ncbi:MAG: hypothetical protein U0Q18_29220 [Bryobacteraceae bacterium]
MNPTTVFTGMLPVALIVSALITAPLSWWLLRRYKAAVIRSMNREAATGTELPADLDRRCSIRMGVDEIPGTPPEHLAPSAAQAYQHANSRRNRNIRAYLLAGLAYACVQSAAWILITKGFTTVRFTWLLVVHLFPIVLPIGLYLLTDRRERSILFGSYTAIVLAVAAVVLARNPSVTTGELIFYVLFTSAPGTVLLFAFLRPGIRAVGPLVLSFTLVSVTGALVAVQAAGASNAVLHALVAFGVKLGLGATTLLILLHVVGLLGFGVLGWFLLAWVGSRYRAKRLSSQTLTIDAVVLLFAVVQSMTFVFNGPAYMLALPLSFAAYKITVNIAFRARSRKCGAAPVLLLLRVFALGARSEHLFRKISSRWLHSGCITLIAGPDLATSNIEPHEFFAFLGGHLVRQFVQGAPDLRERVDHLDRQPDPDGRYRVTEFFCHRNNWQVTMRTLAAQSQTILMDLRGFCPSNQGCLWEIEQLLAWVPLNRIMFAVDGTTDRLLLAQSLDRLSRAIPPDSPNASASSTPIRLFRLEATSDREVESLIQWLYSDLPVAQSLHASAGT